MGLYLGRCERLEFFLQDLKCGMVAVATQLHDVGTPLVDQPVEGRLQCLHLELSVQLPQLSLVIRLSPYNVELAATAPALRIHLVALTCCSKCSALVDELRKNLCRDGVVRTARPEHAVGRRTLGVGITALYHEILDDTVEKRAVVIALLYEFDEIVAVKGCLVVEADSDVAHGGMNLYLHDA